jgi:hypothetical protein
MAVAARGDSLPCFILLWTIPMHALGKLLYFPHAALKNDGRLQQHLLLVFFEILVNLVKFR